MEVVPTVVSITPAHSTETVNSDPGSNGSFSPAVARACECGRTERGVNSVNASEGERQRRERSETHEQAPREG